MKRTIFLRSDGSVTEDASEAARCVVSEFNEAGALLKTAWYDAAPKAQKSVVKHGDHDQSEHGNWARGGSEAVGSDRTLAESGEQSGVKLHFGEPEKWTGSVDIEPRSAAFRADARLVEVNARAAIERASGMGFALPKAIKVVDASAFREKGEVMRYDHASDSVLVSADYVHGFDFYMQRNIDLGFYSAKDAAGVIVHELAHAAHAKADPEFFERASRDPRQRIMPAANWAQDARGVSGYVDASRDVFEFVAEVASGMAAGRSYPPNVMAFYEKLHGPKLRLGVKHALALVRKFDPNQPRDDWGRWTDGGGSDYGYDAADAHRALAQAAHGSPDGLVRVRMSDDDFASKKAQYESDLKALSARLRSEANAALPDSADQYARDMAAERADTEAEQKAAIKAGVDFWHEALIREPSEFKAEADRMREAWQHIGGPGPATLRWAAAMAFGYNEGEDAFIAWDAGKDKDGEKVSDLTDDGKPGPVPWENLDTRHQADAVKWAGIMREEYIDSQLELEGLQFDSIEDPVRSYGEYADRAAAFEAFTKTPDYAKALDTEFKVADEEYLVGLGGLEDKAREYVRERITDLPWASSEVSWQSAYNSATDSMGHAEALKAAEERLAIARTYDGEFAPDAQEVANAEKAIDHERTAIADLQAARETFNNAEADRIAAYDEQGASLASAIREAGFPVSQETLDTLTDQRASPAAMRDAIESASFSITARSPEWDAKPEYAKLQEINAEVRGAIVTADTEAQDAASRLSFAEAEARDSRWAMESAMGEVIAHNPTDDEKAARDRAVDNYIEQHPAQVAGYYLDNNPDVREGLRDAFAEKWAATQADAAFEKWAATNASTGFPDVHAAIAAYRESPEFQAAREQAGYNKFWHAEGGDTRLLLAGTTTDAQREAAKALVAGMSATEVSALSKTPDPIPDASSAFWAEHETTTNRDVVAAIAARGVMPADAPALTEAQILIGQHNDAEKEWSEARQAQLAAAEPLYAPALAAAQAKLATEDSTIVRRIYERDIEKLTSDDPAERFDGFARMLDSERQGHVPVFGDEAARAAYFAARNAEAVAASETSRAGYAASEATGVLLNEFNDAMRALPRTELTSREEVALGAQEQAFKMGHALEAWAMSEAGGQALADAYAKQYVMPSDQVEALAKTWAEDHGGIESAFDDDDEAKQSWYESDAHSQWEQQVQEDAASNLSNKEKVELLDDEQTTKAYEWASDNIDKVEKYTGDNAPTPGMAMFDDFAPARENAADQSGQVMVKLESELLAIQEENGFAADSVKEAREALAEKQVEIKAAVESLVERKAEVAEALKAREAAIEQRDAFVRDPAMRAALVAGMAQTLWPPDPSMSPEMSAASRDALVMRLLAESEESQFHSDQLDTIFSVLGEHAADLKDAGVTMPDTFDEVRRAINEAFKNLEHANQTEWEAEARASDAVRAAISVVADVMDETPTSEWQDAADEKRNEWLTENAAAAWVDSTDEGNDAWQEKFFEDFNAHEHADDSDAFHEWLDNQGGIGRKGPWTGDKLDAEEDKDGNFVVSRGIHNSWQGYVPNFMESYSARLHNAKGFGSNTATVSLPKNRVMVMQGLKHWRTKKSGMGNTEAELLVIPAPPKWAERTLARRRREILEARRAARERRR